MEPDTRYARNGDVHLAYRTWGDGDLDLVLVPGFISHVELQWELPAAARFLERLGSFARVVSFDRRGTGLSDPVSVQTPPDLETRMDDVRAVMDAVGLERAALLGWSEGAPMTVLFAATYPERVSALVLYGAMARTTYSEDHPWLPTVDDYATAGAELLLPKWGQGASIDVSSPTHALDPEIVAFYAKFERASITPGMLVAVAAMFYDTDVRDVLPTVRAPTLVIHRRGDRLVNVRSGRYLAEHIPGARLAELPGIDHSPWFDPDDEITGEIEEFLTGVRAAPEPERRLATVLFSDIVGSTERAADLGDTQWRDLLQQHQRSVREQIARFGGTEVKTLGDGFLATFDGPASAIRCACRVRDVSHASGLAVRIGLHCGEIEVVDEDIAGIAVHIAARVGALAAPNEVLVSRTVKDLVAGSGIGFESRGTHALKGVPDQWELLAVAG